MIDKIVLDLLFQIIKFIEIEDLKKLFRVNKKFSKYSSDESFWRILSFLTIPEYPKIKPNEFSWKKLFYFYNHKIDLKQKKIVYGRYKKDNIEWIGGSLVKDNKIIFQDIGMYQQNDLLFVGRLEEGCFKFGKLYKKNFFCYEGEFKDGIFHGKGKKYDINGIIFEGDFKNGLIEGVGKITYINGDFFQGNFKDNVFHGFGVLSFKNGSIFEGKYKNGFKNGYGVYKYSTGSIYLGLWKDGNKTGFSTYRYSNGISYIGKYENDQRNGEGTLYWPNGDKFEGIWENDYRKGKGFFIDFATSERIEQLWNEAENPYSQKIPEKYP